jgi:nucleoid-associated protein YgaU
MRSIEQAFDQRVDGRPVQKRSKAVTSPHAPTSAAVSSPVRLTRRGRVVLTLVMMVGLVVAGFTLGRGSSQAAGHSHQPRHTVIVQAGDTLWSLAARVAPHADPRDVVAEIQSLNRIPGAVVVPGEQLVVPAAG